jgi:hypothetical protein
MYLYIAMFMPLQIKKYHIIKSKIVSTDKRRRLIKDKKEGRIKIQPEPIQYPFDINIKTVSVPN